MINNITLMGRLTADPELRTTPTGRNVSSFSIAVDRGFARAGEERQTDFINIVAWQQTADFVCRYFRKGSMIALTGSLQTRSYEDKNGNKRTAYEVVAREVSFCGSKAETGAAGSMPVQATPAYQTAKAADFEEIPDDEELPF